MLIGMHGKKRVGKDEAYRVIKDSSLTDLPVDHKSFAAKLKLSAYRVFNPRGTLQEALVWADDIKESGQLDLRWYHESTATGSSWPDVEALTGRQLLQHYGTEAHREVFGDNFWVDVCVPENLPHEGRIVVVTDVRFPNEAQRILDLGGEVWHIVRPTKDDGDEHASERPLPDQYVTKKIYNGGTLEEYREQIKHELASSLHLEITSG